MKSAWRVLALSLAAASLAACASNSDDGSTINHMTRTVTETGYARVNGLEIYYEIHGESRADAVPLVLLHGGGSTLETSFARTLPEFAKTRRVIAFDQQGHGRTADVDRPFTFEQSADDAAALLRHLRVERADLYGYSNGGNIALQVAIRHPSLVRKLVLSSALLTRDGADPAFWQSFDHAKLSDMPRELREEYERVAPRPQDLQSFFDKSVQRMRTFRDVPRDQLRAVTAPVLVLVADGDIVRPEHAVETYRTFPHARLAILPGSDHTTLLARADWIVSMVEGFLDV